MRVLLKRDSLSAAEPVFLLFRASVSGLIVFYSPVTADSFPLPSFGAASFRFSILLFFFVSFLFFCREKIKERSLFKIRIL